MATITRPAQYPNLLVLTGSDIVNQSDGLRIRRGRIKELLFTGGDGVPGIAGQVDFIICFVVNGTAIDHGGVDHSPQPRPLRGIIQWYQDVRNLNPTSLGDRLGWVAHEVGHYWLVPGRAKIHTPEGEIDTPTVDEVAQALNAGQGMPDYPIIGRQDRHWSPFIDGQSSAMEGLPHSAPQDLFETSVGYAYSETLARTGITFDLAGYGAITSLRSYNDLELYVMGVLSEPEFRPSQSIARYVRPRWVFPINFQSGLYAETDQGEIWYLGFNGGPHRLAAQSISSDTAAGTANLAVPFNPYDRVGLRIVQEGSQALLQARVWKRELYHQLYGCLWDMLLRIGFWLLPNPMRDNLTPLDCNDVLNDVVSGSPVNDNDAYVGWKTLATLNGRVQRVGLASRHFADRPVCFVRTRARLCLWNRNGTQTVNTRDLAVENGLMASENEFGVRTRLDDGTLVLPYRTAPKNVVRFQHTAQLDEAPRLVMDAPTGDFAFGGDVELAECVITNWAGGTGAEKQYVGRRGSFTFADFDFSYQWSDGAAIRRTAPPGNTYKMLFCLVSANDLPLTELQPYLDGLDLVRRAWEPCFNELTKGQRFADTTI